MVMPPFNTEVFVHTSKIKGKLKVLKPGERVTLQVGFSGEEDEDPQKKDVKARRRQTNKRRMEAREVRILIKASSSNIGGSAAVMGKQEKRQRQLPSAPTLTKNKEVPSAPPLTKNKEAATDEQYPHVAKVHSYTPRPLPPETKPYPREEETHGDLEEKTETKQEQNKMEEEDEEIGCDGHDNGCADDEINAASAPVDYSKYSWVDDAVRAELEKLRRAEIAQSNKLKAHVAS
uniref:Uncharacterized protein n=1 Tax=Lotharella oceanica TaxID=641309 RepID=A0A7S2TYJ2_9EUKA|mmetsp:Transcript_3555/g.6893  ORF Transcript_3555/g.6893 Transcript_3555/m.6893 type:complete len:233 (+) Transcript_3555:2-700(+)